MPSSGSRPTMTKIRGPNHPFIGIWERLLCLPSVLKETATATKE